MFDLLSFAMVDEKPRLIPLGDGCRCDQGWIKRIIIGCKILFTLWRNYFISSYDCSLTPG